jgi:hypothetical protein
MRPDDASEENMLTKALTPMTLAMSLLASGTIMSASQIVSSILSKQHSLHSMSLYVQFKFMSIPPKMFL